MVRSHVKHVKKVALAVIVFSCALPVIALFWRVNTVDATTVPFTLRTVGVRNEAKRMVLSVTVNSRKLDMALDSGSAHTYIFSKALPDFPLNNRDRSSKNFRVARVQVGRLTRYIPVGSKEMNPRIPLPYQGLLGLDFFTGEKAHPAIKLAIHGAEQTLELDWNNRSAVDRSPNVQLPLVLGQNFKVYGVVAKIENEPPVFCALDTGCQFDLFLPTATAMRIRESAKVQTWPLPVKLILGTSPFQVSADGAEWNTRWPPLIGMPFILKHDATFDFERKVLTLHHL